MKRKGLLIGVVLFGILLAGCKNTDKEAVPEETVTASQETASMPESEEALTAEEGASAPDEASEGSGETMAEAEEAAKQEYTEYSDLTFEDLSKRTFFFSSGAGAWAEEFTIEKDGFFQGIYHDADMGVADQDYPGGTLYLSSYSGHFTGLEKVDEYSYRMTLSDIAYKDEVDTEEIKDGVLYVYTDSYCLGGNDTFLVFLPGTPKSRFSEDVWSWLQLENQSETELTMLAIVDEKNDYGVFSFERMGPLEDARDNFEASKNIYDSYMQQASQGNSTREIKEYTILAYEVMDDCLNHIWQLIRYHVGEEQYQEILVRQRQWIREKEAKAAEVEEEWGGGTFAPIEATNAKAEMTIERCQELIQYLEENLQ